ncbi:hypothetical protein KEJ32_00400 [Candidatus Bathyarchaeota archaeon]|nr:hypothetical protein [Candidatus Bathyarchaeota archaeon]MBS7636548.1 hypothetical protein [Candidatus Bathyarchaeota archaeon]
MKWTKEDMKKAQKISNELVSIISYFDGLRGASVHDPKELLMKTKTVSLNSSYLKYFSKETQKVLKKIGQSGKVRKMIRVNRILNFVTLIYFMIVVVLAILWQRGVILPPSFMWMYWTFLSFPSIILLLILADVTLLMLSLTKYELKKIAEESGVKEEEAMKRRLKEAVQYHIDKLRANIEKYKLKPEDYKIKLQRTDYEGIKVVKKPGILHGYYLAIVDAKIREKDG